MHEWGRLGNAQLGDFVHSQDLAQKAKPASNWDQISFLKPGARSSQYRRLEENLQYTYIHTYIWMVLNTHHMQATLWQRWWSSTAVTQPWTSAAGWIPDSQPGISADLCQCHMEPGTTTTTQSYIRMLVNVKWTLILENQVVSQSYLCRYLQDGA